MSGPRHKYVAARPPPGPELRRLGPLVLVLVVLTGLGLVGFKLWVDFDTQALIYADGDASVPQRHVAMVFGAGLDGDGGPSAILYDRVAAAVDLYNVRKVDKLLMTGDNSVATHNEVEAMRKT